MRYLIGALGLLILIGCGLGVSPKSQTCSVTGYNGSSTINCPDGTSSTVTSGRGCTEHPVASNGIPNDPAQYGGTLITCADATTLVANGTPGYKGDTGATGTAGANGHDLVFATAAASTGQCPSGGTVVFMGQDSLGTGVFNSNDTGVESIVLCDGANGTNAVLPAFSVVSAIAPCTVGSSPLKEELLCLQDGNLLADFSASMSGNETRLSFIYSGNYVDTDDSGCAFQVTVGGSGSSVVSWGAGSNSYGSWVADSATCTNNH